ncbi:MAG: hypothetical protein V3R78_04280, partial [Thermodesulfobacteriota bacterium]
WYVEALFLINGVLWQFPVLKRRLIMSYQKPSGRLDKIQQKKKLLNLCLLKETLRLRKAARDPSFTSYAWFS